MEETFVAIAGTVELLLEFSLVVIVAIGALVAMGRLAMSFGKEDRLARRRTAWTSFASWLLLALEFALAADLVGTAISPTWDEVGQLGVIAVIRTFLGFFLERDIESIAEMKIEGAE
ncbi:DUF1622 domain-containing protein [Altererythrobacter salegens]|uniref:DUF1622 domain-containing protein n=1 Tax=Croceibacterium salegens TaxID=1737568 RepID=A0A6I4SRX5_9SPHN|nr:DUF1622 domain-containing protein [Croceibacterium salegens]MXO58575.1 DUF1622 domain-containing protein [Croceibacterium salegens]